jgi:hypothetical protein
MNESYQTPQTLGMIPERPSLLNEHLVSQIDRALRRVGDFGEVRLIVTKGRLRFIETTQSEAAQDGDRQRE